MLETVADRTDTHHFSPGFRRAIGVQIVNAARNEDAARLATHFWLTSHIADITDNEGQAKMVTAKMRRIRRLPAAAAYRVEARRLEVERKRALADLRAERAADMADLRAGRPRFNLAHATAPTGMERLARIDARVNRLHAAAAEAARALANTWHSAPTRRSTELRVRRPRSCRSRRVVRAAKTTGDPDPEPELPDDARARLRSVALIEAATSRGGAMSGAPTLVPRLLSNTGAGGNQQGSAIAVGPAIELVSVVRAMLPRRAPRGGVGAQNAPRGERSAIAVGPAIELVSVVRAMLPRRAPRGGGSLASAPLRR